VLKSNGTIVITLVYIDDIIITDTNSDSIVAIIIKIQSSFPLKDLDTLHYFLDIEIQPTQTSLHLSQHKYVTYLLQKVNMHCSKPCPTPMIANQPLSKVDGEFFENPTLYRMVIGALQYAIITRPNITFFVNNYPNLYIVRLLPTGLQSREC
jgi:Reverse transcriptase (RNA-dependent DNA polymerase)